MKSKSTLVTGLLLIAVVYSVGQPTLSGQSTTFETRCGWLQNPTPANIWFYDREAEWTIGVQGGYQVPGDWPWPAFKSGQWVRTNVNYGYGCVCFQLRVDKKDFRVLEITRASARSLAACRKDPSLKRWRRMFK